MSNRDHPRPQNVYDNPVFFEGYKSLRQKDSGLNGVLEIPAFHALLPELKGLRILDLGAGFGDFARHARRQGAQTVTAIDISENMLSEARGLTQDDCIIYLHHSIERFSPGAEAFDLVVSSLALHYVEDYSAVVKRVYAGLVPGGKFVFSVERPLCTAQPEGWVCSPTGERLHWPLDRYQYEGVRHSTWFVENVTKFHRTLDTYVNTLLAAGFRLDHLGEPKPVPQAFTERPSLVDALRRPPFLLLAVSKPS